MSYESERKKLYEVLKGEFAKANEIRECEGYRGKDGLAALIEHEAVKQYNTELALLKKKHNKD